MATGAADRDGQAGFWLRTAILFLALWPLGSALAVVRGGMDTRAALVLSGSAASLLFIAAAIEARAPRLRGLFRPWQMACLAILAAVALHGLIRPTHDRALALALALPHLLLALGAIAAALLLRAGGAAAIRAVMLAFGAGIALYIAGFALWHDAYVAKAGGEWAHSFFPFVNLRKFSSLLAAASAMALALWAAGAGTARPLPPLAQALAFAIWAGFATALVWTGGRAPVLALAIAIALALALWPEARLRRRLAAGALAGAVIALVLSASLPRPSLAMGLLHRLSATAAASSVDQLSSLRVGIWADTLPLIAQKPLLGHGYNQWARQRPEFRHHGSAHNLPLQALHDFGLIGGAALLALVFGTWAGHLRRLRGGHPLHLAAAMMLTVLIAQSFLDAIFLASGSLHLVLLTFALASASARLAPPPR